jgi:cytochrome c oxidase subunit III
MNVAHGEQVHVLEEHGQESGRSLNWWGMVFFICSEALIFANLIAAFLYLYIRNVGLNPHINWILPSAELFGKTIPAIIFPAGLNTVILLTSSLFMHMAGTGIRKGNQKQFVRGLTITIILGVIFLGGQAYEYVDFITGKDAFSIGSSIHGSAFYMLTGFHGLHVMIGAIFLTVCLIRGIRGDFTAKKHFAVEAAEMYWHFVDVVWVFVFSVVYILPLFHS